MAKRATRAAAPPAKREKTPRELYRAECVAVAESDSRWEMAPTAEQCAGCESYTAWVAPDASRRCPGCWDWLGDAGADSLPRLEAPRPEPRLPAGEKHPACSRCPATKKRPEYEWGWSSRKKNRKRVLTALCPACQKPCGEVDQKLFAAFAPPLPPPEPEVACLFAEPEHQDPDDEVGYEALDVTGDRDKKASSVRTGKDYLRLRVPSVIARCRSCGWVGRGILWPAGVRRTLWPPGASSDAEFFADGTLMPECVPCAAHAALEAQAPRGLVWAHAEGRTTEVFVPVEQVAESGSPYEPLGYYGLRWEYFRDSRGALAERRRAGLAATLSTGGAPWCDARDSASGAPLTEKDVQEYLRAAREERLDYWTISKFASGIITEIKRRKRA